MTEHTEPCTRGCTIHHRHLDECEGDCRGCLPRRATHGHLCEPCHHRLARQITDAPIAHRWLTGNLIAGEGQAPADTGFITGNSSAPPAPIKLAVLDTRDLLADRIATWVDDLCETKELSGPRTPARTGTGHADRQALIEAHAAYLLTWLSSIERLDWIGDWFEELAETLSQAHALAPWRPAPRRMGSIPCPDCGECNLLIFGGEVDVTCGTCRCIIPEDRFPLWERIVREEHGIGAAS